MSRDTVGIAGRLLIEVRDPDGRIVDRRQGTNTVLSGGQQLLARLLAGQAQGSKIQVAIGLGTAPTTEDMTALGKASKLAPVDVKKTSTAANLVALQASFPVAPGEETITEAGLLITCTTDTVTGPTLYNRVLIEPALVLKTGETLSTNWELSFSAHAGGEA